MVIGAVVFAAGAVMTFTGRREEPADPPSNPPTVRNTDTLKSRSDGMEDSKRKGNEFEDFVADILKANSLTIKEWNKGTVTDNGAFGENALDPDMLVIDRQTKINLEYWLECKFRSSIPSGGFELKDYQMNRYADRQRDSKRKVLVALGLGGSPDNPERFFIIPLDSLLRFKHIPEKYIVKYQVEDPKQNLKRHIRDYFFDAVFKKSEGKGH